VNFTEKKRTIDLCRKSGARVHVFQKGGMSRNDLELGDQDPRNKKELGEQNSSEAGREENWSLLPPKKKKDSCDYRAYGGDNSVGALLKGEG